jgi:ABC-2 type transport system permease protein
MMHSVGVIMKRSVIFAKRNILEMVRDPMIYIFCVGFPVVLIILFAVINSFSQGNTPVFEPKSLVPGILIFSYSFVTLMLSLIVSRDRTSSLLVRLYSSPIKAHDFVIGYALPCFVIGIVQALLCVVAGWIVSLITSAEFFSFGSALLLVLSSLPALIMSIFFGIFIGSALNDKSAPGICSIFISAAGVLSGAWMPLDTMGGFETFCRVLPFYPSVYLGRITTGAVHTLGGVYQFDDIALFGIITVIIYMLASIILAILAFYRKMSAEK